MKYFVTVVLVLFVMVSYGCPPKPVQVQQPYVTGQAITQPETGGPGTGGITEEELAERERRERLLREAAMGHLRDVYFDFDSYAITNESVDILTKAADYLRQNTSTRTILEGHTDERGTIEYNMVLGQKRADAVRAFLIKLGIPASRLKTVSYGKEMPADPGQDEAAWAKNRRVHFNTGGKE